MPPSAHAHINNDVAKKSLENLYPRCGMVPFDVLSLAVDSMGDKFICNT